MGKVADESSVCPNLEGDTPGIGHALSKPPSTITVDANFVMKRSLFNIANVFREASNLRCSREGGLCECPDQGLAE